MPALPGNFESSEYRNQSARHDSSPRYSIDSASRMPSGCIFIASFTLCRSVLPPLVSYFFSNAPLHLTSSVLTRIRAARTQTIGKEVSISFPIASFLSLPVPFIDTKPRPVPANLLLLTPLLYSSLYSMCRFSNPPSASPPSATAVLSLIYVTLTMAQINMQTVFARPSDHTEDVSGEGRRGFALISCGPARARALLRYTPPHPHTHLY
ncbi:hypothetical protein C8J57DRAFT_1519143 [Mycena rebaudengoi]|nr:hypothetical protein C8J57DRAFT_1519143 [Mycena rebaudengoi]